MLAVLTATGTVAGVCLAPAAADAHPPVVTYSHRYEVLVRHGRHWRVEGTYPDRRAAEREAGHLRHRGLDVRIEAC